MGAASSDCVPSLLFNSQTVRSCPLALDLSALDHREFVVTGYGARYRVRAYSSEYQLIGSNSAQVLSERETYEV